MYHVRVVSRLTGKTIARASFRFRLQLLLFQIQWILTPTFVRFIVKRE